MIVLVSNLYLRKSNCVNHLDLCCLDKQGDIGNITFLKWQVEGPSYIYAFVLDMLISKMIVHHKTAVVCNDTMLRKGELDNLRQTLISERDAWLQQQLCHVQQKDIQCIEKEGVDVGFIKQELSNDTPLLLTFSDKSKENTVLVIGYEMNEQEELVRLFCLDAKGPSPQNSYWNATIELVKDGETNNILSFNSLTRKLVYIKYLMVIKRQHSVLSFTPY